ncbi:hypothetical protein OBK12_04100 [Empedobacter falsenii]
MTEEQANEMIDYLKSISDKLESINDRLENVEDYIKHIDRKTDSNYNLKDIYLKLDDIISIIEQSQ